MLSREPPFRIAITGLKHQRSLVFARSSSHESGELERYRVGPSYRARQGAHRNAAPAVTFFAKQLPAPSQSEKYIP